MSQKLDPMVKLDEVEIIKRIKKAADCQDFKITKHAAERMVQRKITLFDIESILKRGLREKRKDTYKVEYRAWVYAFRGKNFDRDNDIRIAVGIDKDVVVVTVINIENKRG